ncbi:FAD-binding protein [Ancylobacter sp. 6x-1]|uniref:UDP-N-acetylenolpyruvoylglucosamine reductase n=1 Tax=Ancylobacter crimeensis TaxID=2579147 RepID=A0ABT0D6M7_9HYPH|nr:FAD-binding protein [Ancylobacter crimeensis]MCK0195605.1 FAD-binding protein [Ancylobacter crimeensis]
MTKQAFATAATALAANTAEAGDMPGIQMAAFEALERFCIQHGIEVQRSVDLADFTYLRAGGTAHVVVFPNTPAQVASVQGFLHQSNLQSKVIGNTSNLLFLDDETYSVLLCTTKMNKIVYDAANGVIAADGGAMMPDLARVALWNAVAGFEGLEGIPGTIGGGIFMNAGAYGFELKDPFLRAEMVHPDGTMRMYEAAEFKLSHRSSILRKESKGSIVVRAYFRAEKGDAEKIYRRMELYHSKRHKYQDFFYPNLGSIYSGSPYRALAHRDPVFRLLSALYYFFRYEFKLFHREAPINRKWLNDLVLKRFDFKYDIQPFSDKTLNCLVNRGQGTAEMVRFIEQLGELSDGRIPLENEIVRPF